MVIQAVDGALFYGDISGRGEANQEASPISPYKGSLNAYPLLNIAKTMGK